MTKLYVTEDWQFNPVTFHITFNKSDRQETLDPKQGKVLKFIMDHGQELVTRDDIYKELFGFDPAKADSTINSYISKLRKVLEPSDDESRKQHKYIRTIPKQGYQFVAKYNIEEQEIVKPERVIKKIREPQTIIYDVEPKQPEPTVEREFNLKKLILALSFVVLVIALTSWALAFLFKPSHTLPHYNKKEVIIHDQGSETEFAVSPDERFVIYVNQLEGIEALKIKYLDSGKTTQLYQAPSGHLFSPALSPDLNKLLFVSTANERCEIMKMNLDFSGEQLQFSAPQFVTSCGEIVIYSHVQFIDNNKFLYTYNQNLEKPSKINIFDLVANGFHTLTSPPQYGAGDLVHAYSALNNEFAFLRIMANDSRKLYIYNLDSAETRLITDIPANNAYISWLDKDHILTSNNKEILAINIHNKQQKSVSAKFTNLMYPTKVNNNLYAREGAWFDWSIVSLDLTTGETKEFIATEYNEYLPKPVSNNTTYYASVASGAFQIWQQQGETSKLISRFDDDRQIKDFIVDDDLIWILNQDYLTLIDLDGAIIKEVANDFNAEKLLAINNHVLYLQTINNNGSFIVAYNTKRNDNNVVVKQIFDAVVNDDGIVFVSADKQTLHLYDFEKERVLIKHEAIATLSKNNWHFNKGNLLKIVGQRVSSINLKTNQSLFNHDIGFYTANIYCKNVESQCFLSSLKQGNIEITRIYKNK